MADLSLWEICQDLDHLIELGLIKPVIVDGADGGGEVALEPTADGLAYYAERYAPEDEQLRQFTL